MAFLSVLAALSYAQYGGGDGSPETPYLISTPAHLAAVNDNLSAHFKLVNTISLAGQPFSAAVIAPDTNSTIGGFQGLAFTGSFDGDGYVINDLTINGSGQDFLGLFGLIGSTGRVINLGLENVFIDGRDFVGGLCGQSDGKISRSYVIGQATGNYWIGGLAGGNYFGAVIDYSYADVAVSANETYGGGLCGLNSGLISRSYALGDLTGKSRIGGLCGENSYGVISRSYAAGDVGGQDNVGGLCGVNWESTLQNCYAVGDVTGQDTVGGLMGHNYQGTVIHCYAAGKPTGDSAVGGLCGTADTGGDFADTGNFWDTDTSETDDSAMGLGLTTLEMQTQAGFIDAGWDFLGETVNGTASVWRMCIDDVHYPYLQWTFSQKCDWDCPDGVNVEDLDFLAARWLLDDCGTMNDCDGADIHRDGVIDLHDFAILAGYWLAGS